VTLLKRKTKWAAYCDAAMVGLPWMEPPSPTAKVIAERPSFLIENLLQYPAMGIFGASLIKTLAAGRVYVASPSEAPDNNPLKIWAVVKSAEVDGIVTGPSNSLPPLSNFTVSLCAIFFLNFRLNLWLFWIAVSFRKFQHRSESVEIAQ
jgi:hypothetical protein